MWWDMFSFWQNSNTTQTSVKFDHLCIVAFSIRASTKLFNVQNDKKIIVLYNVSSRYACERYGRNQHSMF